VEITVWSVNAATATIKAERAAKAPSIGLNATPLGQRDLFDAALGVATASQVFARADLALGSVVQGPALITEEETTVVLTQSRFAHILSDGCIDVIAKEA
jgi:N-methylhydantoinase A